MDAFHVLGGYFEDIQDSIPEGIYLKMYDTLKAIKDDHSHVGLLYENQRLTSVCNRAMRQRVNLLASIRDRDLTLQTTVELLEKSREEQTELKHTNKRLRVDLSKLEEDTERFINPLTGRSIKSTSQLAKKLKRLKGSEDA